MAWHCNGEGRRLVDFTYIPDPVDGYRNAPIRCMFMDRDATEVKTWDNSALQSLKAVRGLVVLTAWLATYGGGFCTFAGFSFPESGPFVARLYTKGSDPFAPVRRVDLPEGRLPLFARQAVAAVRDGLEAAYGDPYLDV